MTMFIFGGLGLYTIGALQKFKFSRPKWYKGPDQREQPKRDESRYCQDVGQCGPDDYEAVKM
jgi:hypothetical protein